MSMPKNVKSELELELLRQESAARGVAWILDQCSSEMPDETNLREAVMIIFCALTEWGMRAQEKARAVEEALNEKRPVFVVKPPTHRQSRKN